MVSLFIKKKEKQYGKIWVIMSANINCHTDQF